tara:strand:+ start:61 stop:336 length:276 start_codon:yes stop_codon:yes gene_type:complete
MKGLFTLAFLYLSIDYRRRPRVVKLTKRDWDRFTAVYGEDMYKDKLRCSVIPSEDNAAYVEVIFGQGINHTGYDLVEQFQTLSNQQGELDV